MRLLYYISSEEEKGREASIRCPGTYQTGFPDRPKGRIMFILSLSNHLGATDSSVMTKYGLPSCWKTNGSRINESLSFPG